MERVSIQNSRGEKLAGILHDTKSKELIIICHGYKGSKDYIVVEKLAAAIESAGFSVLRFDFTGHGESEGAYEVDIIQQVSDIRSVMDTYTAQYEKIILLGGSFAGFITCMAAARYSDVDALIEINGLYYLQGIGKEFYGFLIAALFDKRKREQLKYYRKYFRVERIRVPVLLIHAITDSRVDVEQSKKLYEKLRAEKEFRVLPLADHYVSDAHHIKELSHMCVRWLRKQYR